MKSQLVMQDMSGVHNANLLKTQERLFKGGSWRKQRVIMLIPADHMIPAKVYLSHRSLVFPPNQHMWPILAQGFEVGEAYSQTISGILDHSELSKWEYLLTIEHDNCPPPDGLLKLIEDLENHKEYCCVSGLYFTKGEGGVAQIWGDPQDPQLNFRPQVPRSNELQECCGVGMGFALWRLSLFKDVRLRKPWFQTQAHGNGVGTQDLHFWADARKYGYRCAVDCRVQVGHYDINMDMVW
jgi:hypothetical protein